MTDADLSELERRYDADDRTVIMAVPQLLTEVRRLRHGLAAVRESADMVAASYPGRGTPAALVVQWAASIRDKADQLLRDAK